MATILDEMIELEDGRKVAPASIPLEAVKGAAAAMGVDKLSAGEMQNMQKAAEIAFHESLRPVRRRMANDDDWSRVSPEMRFALRGAAKSASSNDMFLQQMYAMANAMPAELRKDITLTSPVSTGLVPYDLATGARLQYPVYSPIRNKIPRTQGEGVAKHFKKITSITNSSGAPWTSFFMAELPNSNFTSLNYPTAMTLSGSDATVNYAFMGLGNNASLLAQIAGRGFQDVDALLNQTLLQGMMQSEEIAMLYARTSQAAAPTGLSNTAQTPGTGFVALTGVTTNVYAKVTAVTGLGETTGSTAQSSAPNGAQDLLLAWTDVPGAIYYNAYLSTGNADPGDASRFFAGSSPTNSLEIGGALPTTGNTVPLANTTTTTNGYLGMVADITANGGYTKRLNAGWSSGVPELQTAFGNLYSSYKARPEEIWMSGHDRLKASGQIVGNGTANQAYRVAYNMDEAGRLTGGVVVTSLYNETTGDEVPITVHPWLQQGTCLMLSYKLPFAYSETPNVWENVMVQDYLGLQFPQFDLARRFAIVAYGALVDWAPVYNGIISGIAA